MKEKIKKIIPDFFEYYLESDLEDYESEDDFIISTLEHEVDLYTNWRAEGFKNQQKVSYINKSNIKKVKKLLDNYYKKCDF